MTAALRALIVGGTGQDGSYLAQTLLNLGFIVHATSRSLDDAALANWRQLGIDGRIRQHRLDPTDMAAVAVFVAAITPDQLYVLAGQSSVGLSFSIPGETILSHVQPVVAACEAVYHHAPNCHVVVASSGEVFGETSANAPAREDSPFRPLNPYASAKVMVVEVARMYRERMGIKVSIAYLFNHESPLRPERFVFGKVRAGIAAIREGKADILELGNGDVVRDWGWAPDYCEGLARLARLDQPQEIILATGHSVSLRGAVAALLGDAGLDPERHVEWSRESVIRPSEARTMVADPAKARSLIDWNGSTAFPDLAIVLNGKVTPSPGSSPL